ncbi:MAG: YbaB/EbfC family nucleoid-associated protein [Micrococcales bacterium]|nr:YbaB/EbfC family nucleoid-associated protein [Micrococcales bacterium]
MDRDTEGAQQRAADVTQFRTNVEQVRGRATSRYRDVTAVTDVDGRLVDLELTSDAVRRDPRDLARIIVDTADEARRHAGSQALTMARQTFGDRSGLVVRLQVDLR